MIQFDIENNDFNVGGGGVFYVATDDIPIERVSNMEPGGFLYASDMTDIIFIMPVGDISPLG